MRPQLMAVGSQTWADLRAYERRKRRRRLVLAGAAVVCVVIGFCLGWVMS